MTSPATADALHRRLFFALWPDQALRTQLHELGLRALPGGGKRRMPPEDIHLTLLFLASVPAQIQTCLQREAAQLACAPFTLRLDQIGHWPRPGICWLAPSHPPQALLALARALRGIAAHCGLSTERRPYMPHVTLSRQTAHGSERKSAAVRWRVHSFALVESVPRTAPRYQVLQQWRLRSEVPAERYTD